MNVIESNLAPARPGLVGRVVDWLVPRVTSRHGRRILFITSLYFQIVSYDQLRADVITKLNSLMKLASSEKALQLPIAIRGVLWNGSEITEIIRAEDFTAPLSEERARSISERVVDHMPRYLAYGQRREMVDDVLNLIRNGGTLARAA